MTIDAQQSLAIRVNGEHRRVPGGISVSQMLAELGLDPRRVAVERNLEVVPRATLADVPVADGDAFEVVHFVGGG
jgi:thiamine biosynthesis protein ThiS